MAQFPKITKMLIILASALIGGCSLLLFLIFLYVRSFGWINLGLSKPMELAFDSMLCMVFFVQHSTMIRKSFKNRLCKIIPAYYHGAVYSITSGTILLILIVLWQDSHHLLFSLTGELRWILRIIFFLSIGIFVWGCLSLGSFDFFGIQPILTRIQCTKDPDISLVIRGPYRWVRHPLYMAMLLLIWSCPDISIERLLFNTLWTGWIIVATLLEERDLVNEFGAEYIEYKRKVPILFPWRLKPLAPSPSTSQ